MKNTTKLLISACVTLSLLSTSYLQAGERQLLWGDTHLHTSISGDVYAFGTTNASLDDAYNFAKGKPVMNSTTGTWMRLTQPLDFLVVSDHAELMGSVGSVFSGFAALANTETGRKMLEGVPNKTDEEFIKLYGGLVNGLMGWENNYGLTAKEVYVDLHAGKAREATWKNYANTADNHNNPGEFTSFIGWEWSSQPNGYNLHRVVFSPSDAATAASYLPFSMLESNDPEDLWAWLDKTAQEFDTDFVAIPHNPNLSNGLMFPMVTQKGDEITADYAQRRMRWERVVEVTQIKGDSEAHPLLSPTDEFADYETFEFLLRPDGKMANVTAADYARSGLKRGLELQAKTGSNPYKFGMIGSTDAHASLAAVEEDNFVGKSKHDAFPERRKFPTGLGSSKGWDMGAAGYVGVWADENTRQSIFEAFKRREVYATTGPRISLRFFGGYDFSRRDAKPERLAKAGYDKGVTMGSDLLPHKKDKAPVFLIQAVKDPNEANLDRIQVVKGWVDADGKSHEKVFNVAASDKRKIKDNQLEPVGNTVDLATGRYTNSIGATDLSVRWSDPEFNPAQAAFYYVRVLQIPTPRYSLLDAIALGIDVKETGHPSTIQERAYSSPIWFTPTQD